MDIPTYATVLGGDQIEDRVPTTLIGAKEGIRFDGVTPALQVNANLHAPLLGINDVSDVASGDLSLRGRVTP